jgi:hypothetical protein
VSRRKLQWREGRSLWEYDVETANFIADGLIQDAAALYEFLEKLGALSDGITSKKVKATIDKK